MIPYFRTKINRRKQNPSNDNLDDSSGATQREQQNGDHEKGGEGSPKPVGFWHSGLKTVRRKAFLKWGITTLTLMTFILSVLSLYWAVFTHVNKNISSLVIHVIDFDGIAPYNNERPTLVGPIITNVAREKAMMPPPHLGYEIHLPSEYGNDPLNVRRTVYEWNAWAAIVINPNATAMLYDAINTGNSSYEPLGACQLIYQDSRDDTNYYDFILPELNMVMREMTMMVGQRWIAMVMQNATNDPALARNLQRVPQALSPAIGFSEYNLRPFYPWVVIPAVSIGLIYLIIISFFSFSFYLPIHVQYINPKGHPPLKFWQFIIWRYLATVSAYLFLSLAYSLISLAFQINFFHGPSSPFNPTNIPGIEGGNAPAYGHGTFVVYWMLNFWGMMALGLACENIAMIIGQPWMGLWLIFWVITNVSTAFYDIDIEPRFYYWGYAWPLHQVVEASRQILFDLHSRIGLNFGILIAWAAVSSTIFPFACYFLRWKTQKNIHEYWPMD